MLMELGFCGGNSVKNVINTCAYTGRELARRARTFEHILPKSKGGTYDISNGLVTAAPVNHARGNIPLSKWFKMHPDMARNVQKYLDKYRGIKIMGRDYVEEVKRTLNDRAAGVVSFKGKKLNIKA